MNIYGIRSVYWNASNKIYSRFYLTMKIVIDTQIAVMDIEIVNQTADGWVEMI